MGMQDVRYLKISEWFWCTDSNALSEFKCFRILGKDPNIKNGYTTDSNALEYWGNIQTFTIDALIQMLSGTVQWEFKFKHSNALFR